VASAAITGAASGIGAAFARALAPSMGRLLLIDRDAAGLEARARELAELGPAEPVPVVADLALGAGRLAASEALRTCGDLELLVNNAGFGYPKAFAEAPRKRHVEMVGVHVAAMVELTHAALPGMLERGRGGVVNMSAIAEALQVPGNVMYGATKAFARRFSEILRHEVQPQGVRVQLLVPGYTRTRIHEGEGYADMDPGAVPDWWWASPDEIARASLRDLERGRFLCVAGGPQNWLFYWVLRSGLVPPWVYTRWLV